MKTRIIHTKIWQDEWFVALPRASKLVFIYLLSCPQNNLCGIFELSDRQIMFDVDIEKNELEQSKNDLKGRVIFFEGWIKMIKAELYNGYGSSPKLKIAINKELNLIPDKILENIDTLSIPYPYHIHTPINHKSKTIKGGVGGNRVSNSQIKSVKEINNDLEEGFSDNEWLEKKKARKARPKTYSRSVTVKQKPAKTPVNLDYIDFDSVGKKEFKEVATNTKTEVNDVENIYGAMCSRIRAGKAERWDNLKEQLTTWILNELKWGNIEKKISLEEHILKEYGCIYVGDKKATTIEQYREYVALEALE